MKIKKTLKKVAILIFVAMFVARSLPIHYAKISTDTTKQTFWGGEWVQVPSPFKCFAFGELRSDHPSFTNIQNPYKMRSSKDKLGKLCPADKLSAILTDFFERNSELTTNQRLTDMFGALVGSDCFALTDRLERANYFHTYQELMALVTNLQNAHSINLKAQEVTL